MSATTVERSIVPLGPGRPPVERPPADVELEAGALETLEAGGPAAPARTPTLLAFAIGALVPQLVILLLWMVAG